MSLTLRTPALKFKNSGGGAMHRIDRKEGVIRTKVDRGSDYIVFECPNETCGRRQKHCMYDMEAYHDPRADIIPFKCKFCRVIVEVMRPLTAGIGAMIVTPEEFTAQQRRQPPVNSPKLVRP